MTSAVAGVKRPFAAMAVAELDGRHATPGTSRTSPPRRNTSQQDLSKSPRARPVEKVKLATPNSSPPLAIPTSIDAAHIFEPDVSIVLTGIRGAGKSTLAIIASTAMNRKVIDSEKVFQEATGLSSSAYKKQHGGVQCSRRKTSVLREIMVAHRKNAIIVCSWMEREVQAVLREATANSPVLLIVRDPQAIHEHLKVPDDSKFRDLLAASGYVFRRCTQFEFFNVSEMTQARPSHAAQNAATAEQFGSRAPPPYLALKRAERHFLRFLSLIFPSGTIPFFESAFPLAGILTEDRLFTSAVSVPFSSLISQGVNTEEIETGSDAIEIVIDDLIRKNLPQSRDLGQTSPPNAVEISHVLGQIRRSTLIPVLYHVAVTEAILSNEVLRALYLSYVCHGFRLAPEYISVDLRLDETILAHVCRMKGNSKIIGDVQEMRADSPGWKSSSWVSYYRTAQRIGCDLVRFTRPASEITDNFDIRHVQAAVDAEDGPKLPLIIYNTGFLGRTSACFNQILTSVAPEPHAQDKSSGNELTEYMPPSITAVQKTQALYSSFVYDPMNLFVIGANVDYSLSPAMHGDALQALGIPCTYHPRSTNSVNVLLEMAQDPHFAGASLGLPYKVEVMHLLKSMSIHARAIGAANTLIPMRYINEDGSVPKTPLLFKYQNRSGPVKGLYGENTDWIGMRACIRRGLSPANAVRPSTSGLIIGAGGMARAAAYAMLQLGVKNIAVLNRSIDKAQAFVAHFQKLLLEKAIPLSGETVDGDTKFHVIESLSHPWPADFRHPTIIMSCIPTKSNDENPPPDLILPEDWLSNPTGGVVIELAYEVVRTPLLSQIRDNAHRGWVAMDGLDTLPEQGFAQFELFTGRRAPRSVMRRAILKATGGDQGRSNFAQLQLASDS
ncbi:uncharacterized protein E0L32_011188 [Thyridium curvatum]|uniref:Uncharacterized protein n=1 Tax=Thyridium curvatum TaxID=1093900 RepID=A0A507B7G7_9PEZI|nr:uncharacterized protein E0L32_011188 [Thyridium curvatum]TPX19115.1 hypothetical protein E0L32_011188 [Thyridium curvatum]